MLDRYFLAHPRSVGESYGEHMGQALFFARHLLLGGVACLVHAFLPFLFERTGSGRVAMLHDRMITNRVSAKPAAVENTRVAAE
ncbi:hypothetical protein SAMN05444678_10852 [Sphingomonas sp. YR710]|jgi:hypothetical protein|uniref:DUF6356 family protein n=1 Tax=Sphingomonas sp. YR710 TaxID=1882773 RepID=UPI00087F64C0|nr:DUF6356 family protein [Sphingomonas sp. YR710]SDD03039.1 hypothetical protein SAMN05444678_10852 [Sphingomonas sp. YR710]